MEEIWKDIKGYEGLYQVSNLGNVMSLNWNHTNTSQPIRPFRNRGYLRVTFRVNGTSRKFLVHRLVADAFLPNEQGKETVNHIDGNKENNCISNLEWATRREQTAHAIKTGLRPYNIPCKRGKGADSPQSKPVAQFTKHGDLVKSWPCSFTASNELGFDINCIRNCAAGYKKSYRGYIWKYI